MSVRTLTGVILAAQIQNLRTTSVTQTTIALAWDAYPGATAYQVRRNGTLISTPTGTTYSNSGHTAGTSYTYAVRPVVGGSGVASAEASIVVTTVGAGTLLLFDSFEYVVNRDNPTLPGPGGSAFVTQGPWSNVKAVNITGGHIGRLYTTQSIPGYTGAMPGQGSRVLKMESINVSGGSDFYLQYSQGIPANVWFQWWMYINHHPTGPYGPELSGIENRHKFIYPTNADFPSNSNKWLFTIAANPHPPLMDAFPFGSPTAQGQAFLMSRDNMVGTVNYAPNGPDNASKLGPNLQPLETAYVPANQWHLIKVHYDTSGPQGTFEVWVRPLGGSWRKLSEFIGGVTPGFSWTGYTPGGHTMFRMPTTLGWSDTSGGAHYYIDDFAMADSETALPQYG